MSEWLDKIYDDYLVSKADENIEAQKRQIAIQNSIIWKEAILKQLRQDIEAFGRKFTPDRIGGLREIDGRYDAWTNQPPLRQISLMFESDCVRVTRISIKPITGEERDVATTLLRIKASIDGNTWIDNNGKKLVDAPSVSDFVLREIIVAALPA